MAFIYDKICWFICFMPYLSKYMGKRSKNKFCPMAILKMSDLVDLAEFVTHVLLFSS